MAGPAELQGGLSELRCRHLAGSPGYVQRCFPLAGPGVHSLAELQGSLPGLRSWSHGRERRLDPGVPPLILWAGGFACFLAALWGTFHLALLLAWLFTWSMAG